MHDVYTPVARLAGAVISRNTTLREWFRRSEFKGKQLVSAHVATPSANGVFRCNGHQFDIDFTDGIQRAIYLGTYERRERAFLHSYVQPGWTCVDIGANVGFYTLHMAASTGPSGVVHAVEASAKNAIALRRNVALNAAQNVRIHEAAITSQDGLVEFHTSPAANSGWGRIERFAGAAAVISVQGLTFDTFVRRNDIDRVDFLKIDIEGHELEFLRGAADTLARGLIKRMMVEFCGCAFEPAGVSLGDYVQAFETHGFRPTRWCLDEIAKARRGRYVPRGAVLNLLFER